MEVGETFQIDGYDVNARIEYARGDGRVVVLCNNSSHFIVASASMEEDGGVGPDAVFIESFRYDRPDASAENDDEAQFQYRRALNKAVHIALSR